MSPNAIQYAKNEKKIDIRCTQENGCDPHLGFQYRRLRSPKKNWDKILDPQFYKGSTKARIGTREYGGSGYRGLSIVKAILGAYESACLVCKINDNGVEFLV